MTVSALTVKVQVGLSKLGFVVNQRKGAGRGFVKFSKGVGHLCPSLIGHNIIVTDERCFVL